MKIDVNIPKLILIICLYLSLIRGTSIGLFLPSDEHNIGDIDYSITKYMNYLILAGILAYLFFENNYKPLIEKLFSPTIILFISICLISIIWSVDQIESVKFMVVVTAISLPLVLYFYKFGQKKLMDHMTFFAVALCYLCLIYIILMPQYGIMSGKHDGAWRGLFPHKNIFGPFFAISFFFFANQFHSSGMIYRLVLAFAIALSLIFVILSKSSTAIIGFALMGVIYGGLLILFRMPNMWERIGIIIGLITLMISFLILDSDLITEFIVFVTGKDISLSGRTDIWIPLLDLSAQRPIFGYGFGMAQRSSFIAQIQNTVGFEVQSSHNSYLDLIIGIGYPGTIIFMLIILKAIGKGLCFKPANKLEISQYALIFSQIIMLLIVSMTTSSVLLSRSIFWIFMLMSLLMINDRQQPQRNS
ncbi:MAG: O-antigen ligase family protein [Alphaproteobacteria bacterium]|nr:O-antigen ligase family protein [Alphaproteobacteria bacterium]